MPLAVYDADCAFPVNAHVWRRSLGYFLTRLEARNWIAIIAPRSEASTPLYSLSDEARRGRTGVELAKLKELGARLCVAPEGFNLHRTIRRGNKVISRI